jgi:hypothetical protein
LQAAQDPQDFFWVAVDVLKPGLTPTIDKASSLSPMVFMCVLFEVKQSQGVKNFKPAES